MMTLLITDDNQDYMIFGGDGNDIIKDTIIQVAPH